MPSLPLMPACSLAERCNVPQARVLHCKLGTPHRSNKGPTRCTICCATDPGRDAGPGDAASPDRASSDAGASAMPDTLPVAGVDTDWREFRARLVAGSQKKAAPADRDNQADATGQTAPDPGHWAHSIPRPEQGCLLVAHPLMFIQGQTYFHQAIIFLFEHDEHGSCGLILNRSTKLQLGKVSGSEAMCPEFAESELFLGGDVGNSTVHMLHGKAGLPGSRQVVQGVHLGGFEAAKSGVHNGHLESFQFRWFARYSGWAPGQLQREVENGVWFCAAAGPSLVLQPNAAGAAIWHTTLDLMGGEFADMSAALRTSYTGYRPDIMGHDKGSKDQPSPSADTPQQPESKPDEPGAQP